MWLVDADPEINEIAIKRMIVVGSTEMTWNTRVSIGFALFIYRAWFSGWGGFDGKGLNYQDD